MLIERHIISTACRCHGCDRLSRYVKGRVDDTKVFLEKIGWTERMELRYGKNATRRRGMGYVMNYYCKQCTKKGVTARDVAERAKLAGKSTAQRTEHATVGKGKTRKVSKSG
jgi:hypothetical protein